jgi:hypothetical protein
MQRLFLVGAALLCLAGCGGEVATPFSGAAYVEITQGGVLNPTSVRLENGARIVFLNKDMVSHMITWNSPLSLSASVAPGDRAWFELPAAFPGTVLSYHLDSGGAGGSVTVVVAQ